jgi:hypothetical protein
MNITMNNAAEQVQRQQDVCDKSDVALLSMVGAELLVGNMSAVILLSEQPTPSAVVRSTLAVLGTSILTSVVYRFRQHDYDVLDSLRGQPNQG